MASTGVPSIDRFTRLRSEVDACVATMNTQYDSSPEGQAATAAGTDATEISVSVGGTTRKVSVSEYHGILRNLHRGLKGSRGCRWIAKNWASTLQSEKGNFKAQMLREGKSREDTDRFLSACESVINDPADESAMSDVTKTGKGSQTGESLTAQMSEFRIAWGADYTKLVDGLRAIQTSLGIHLITENQMPCDG